MTLAISVPWLDWLTAPKDGPILVLLALVLVARVLGRRSRRSSA